MHGFGIWFGFFSEVKIIGEKPIYIYVPRDTHKIGALE